MSKKTYTPQEAKSRYESLPPEIKSLLYSPEMLMTIRQVAQKNQLHIDQTGILEDETSAVMLGFTPVNDYPAVLAETIGIDSAKAGEIAKDINDLLFVKIRDAMKKTYEAGKSAPAPAVPAPVPVTVSSQASSTSPVTPKATEPHPADMMLTQKTVSVAPPAPVAPKPVAPIPPVPQPYKADPYREPTN